MGATMMNNVLVYAIADKYDIPDLKELAKNKFRTLALSKWPIENFDNITEEVFSTTPDGDMGLRQIVLDVCSIHFQEILRDKGSRASLLDNSAIAAVVSDAAVRKFDEDKTLLDEALAKHAEAVNEALAKHAEATNEAVGQKEAWMTRLDSLFANAGIVHECRHCHEGFNWYLERLGGQRPNMRLRCAICQGTHILLGIPVFQNVRLPGCFTKSERS